jgi:hypothetical protein
VRFSDAVADALAALSARADLDALAAGLDDPDPAFRERTIAALGK